MKTRKLTIIFKSMSLTPCTCVFHEYFNCENQVTLSTTYIFNTVEVHGTRDTVFGIHAVCLVVKVQFRKFLRFISNNAN